MKPEQCTTHHHACGCREYEFQHIAKELHQLRSENERLQEAMDTKYWDRIRNENVRLRAENERLKAERDECQKWANIIEETVDNVREAMGLESTHYLVLPSQVADVVKQNERLRGYFDKYAKHKNDEYAFCDKLKHSAYPCTCGFEEAQQALNANGEPTE